MEIVFFVALGLLVLRSPLTYISFITQIIEHGHPYQLALPYLRFGIVVIALFLVSAEH